MSELAVSKTAQVALIRLLVKQGLLEQAVADTYVQGNKKSDNCPIAFFAQQGKLDERAALHSVSKTIHIPFLELNKAVAAQIIHLLEHPLLQKITLARWRELRTVPFEIGDKHLSVAMANPLDHEAKGALEFDIGKQVRVYLCSEQQILGLLSNKLNDSALFDLESIAPQKKTADIIAEANSQETSVFQGEVSEAPIIRLVNKIFSDAVSMAASDVHFTPEKDKVLVKVRVDGIMQALLDYPAAARASVSTRIKLMCGMDITEHRKPQDGRLRIKTPLGSRDLRVSVVPTVHGENIVARILSSELTHVSFESLGADLEMAKRLKGAMLGSSRVVLVTGPTGSGKTSTLYAGLLSLHDGQTNIITIEDPIEYRVPGINQIQVNAKSGMTFADTLRAVLRQDPDVIMVGEIRDDETAAIAIQVAQTGHLVLSTLHTNTAAGAITRLKDLNVASYSIAASLGAIVAQRLVRKLCASCAVAGDSSVIARLKELGVPHDMSKMAHGCEQCGGSGYKGRCGIYSLIEVNDEIREAIRQDLSEQEIEEFARNCGFKSLELAGIELVANGLTTLEEVEKCLGQICRQSLLPKIKKTQNSAVQQLPLVVATKATGPINKRKVLLVEDEEDTRTVLTMLLQREQFDVLEAANGIEGLEMLYKNIPDLVLTDLMMPKMSGIEMVQKIKNDPRLNKIPILVLTAADGSDNELKLISGGVDDFISKATDSKILLARVSRLLSRTL